MSELACYFDRAKSMEVHLVLYSRIREVFYPLTDSILLHKPEFVFDNRKRWFYTIKTFFFLRNKIKNISPDAIISFGEDWNNLVLLSQLGLPHPVYVADRAEPGLKRSRLHEFLRAWLYRGADGIIVQTETAREIYKRKFKNSKIVAIGNPIRKIGASESISEKENIILSVGRLVDTKHFDQLIKIFAEIDRPDWKLVIVGGDSQRQNVSHVLENLIKEYGLEKRVLLTGTVSNVEEYYRKSKIFAFTSSSEGFPNVIGEAMSAGLPVVAFDCVAGPSELIEDGKTGFLVPLFDSEYFKKKLKKLMGDPDLRRRMGRQAAKRIKKYSIESIGNQFYSLIGGE